MFQCFLSVISNDIYQVEDFFLLVFIEFSKLFCEFVQFKWVFMFLNSVRQRGYLSISYNSFIRGIARICPTRHAAGKRQPAVWSPGGKVALSRSTQDKRGRLAEDRTDDEQKPTSETSSVKECGDSRVLMSLAWWKAFLEFEVFRHRLQGVTSDHMPDVHVYSTVCLHADRPKRSEGCQVGIHPYLSDK